ncbi:MAG: phosphoenolpyruvate synthase, partial [Hymenobacteraceae bacterium]|nr:phosphoenolpyruvate synthase [Hymenobacteraceae bacterium]MDX5513328.1 phosphoenolpyruvate synthase [Hymenobacteraceae bacterium]
MKQFVRPFRELTNQDTELVGGKNASLGEMLRQLDSKGINVPDGFATTSAAYNLFLDQNNIREKLTNLLNSLNDDFSNLQQVGEEARNLVLQAEMPEEVAKDIAKAYEELQLQEPDMTSVAVRSSATAEDLPDASFAGQHDSFLNIQGAEEVVQTCKKCFASLFNDRAIKYRHDHGFEHMKVALSAGVQRMVRSDKACAGVGFTIAPESGFKGVIFLTGNWGLGENVVQGAVNADEFYVFKEGLRQNKKAILTKKLGTKEKTMIYSEKAGKLGSTQNTDTSPEKQRQFVLSDAEITQLAKWALQIEEHYGKAMDIEWAKDGISGELFIVQARPETVHGSKKTTCLKSYKLTSTGKILTAGNAIGTRIAAGKARILQSPKEIDKVQKGDVLVTDITNPDWEPVMKKASAIVTNSGGRTSHAAIVARELGAVAIVGTANATSAITDGAEVTVSCAEGETGNVYEGKLEWEESEINLQELGQPQTQAMLILANPEQAFQFAKYPVAGVGLLRLEFAINNSIEAHPLALLNLDNLEDQEAKQKIQELVQNHENPAAFFVDKLTQAVATIAAAFYPRDVIVRMSDFKSNEYANLLGGAAFEPKEENPMIGFRGASRYYHDAYKEGFKLEC